MATRADIRRRFVTLVGQRVSYLEADGDHDAPTLVFIHGSGVSARYWSDQLRGLAGMGRVLALDLPGHGESDEASAPSLAHYAGVTARLLDELAAWPAIAVGHSLGGSVAITLAARRARDVRGLVLMSSCACLPPVSTPVQWLWGVLPATLRRALFYVTAKNMLFAAGASPAAIALGMQELRACHPRTLAADVAIARAMDLTAVAAALRVPTLILCGSRDRVTPPELSRRLHATIAGSTLQIVDGAGHMLLIEAAGVVNRAIAAFADACARRRPIASRIVRAAASTWSARWRRVLQRLVRVVLRR
jgi:pimeloyl-ACP methyl ester carboxylesterase